MPLVIYLPFQLRMSVLFLLSSQGNLLYLLSFLLNFSISSFNLSLRGPALHDTHNAGIPEILPITLK